MPKRIVATIVVMIALLLLTGCTMKYTFDFVWEKDAENMEGAWNVQEEVEYLALGAYLDDDALTSPFRFMGDITVEVTFLINTEESDHMQWLEFYLIDSDSWSFGDCIGLGMHLDSPTAGTNWIGQRDAWVDGTGPLSGLVADGANKLTISRVGDEISIKLNNHEYDSYSINAANLNNDYNFIIIAYDDGNDQHKGIYVQKVAISYESGNRIAVD